MSEHDPKGPGHLTSPTKRLESLTSDAWLVQKLNLQCVDGADRGVLHAPRTARTVVGTHRSADLVLTDTTVSRFHCELLLSDAGAWIRDLGSKNGTWLNGIRVREALLGPKLRLTLGRDEFRLEVP